MGCLKPLKDPFLGTFWTIQKSVRIFFFLYESVAQIGIIDLKNSRGQNLVTCILQKLQWLPPTPLQNYDLFNMRSIQQSLQTVRSMCTDSQKKKFRYTVYSRYTLLRIRIQIGLVLRTFVDPDPYSEYGSGSTQVNLDKFAPDPN